MSACICWAFFSHSVRRHAFNLMFFFKCNSINNIYSTHTSIIMPERESERGSHRCVIYAQHIHIFIPFPILGVRNFFSIILVLFYVYPRKLYLFFCFAGTPSSAMLLMRYITHIEREKQHTLTHTTKNDDVVLVR